MNVALTILFILVGFVLGMLVLLRIAKVSSWYLPSMSNAKLSKEMSTNLAVLTSHLERVTNLSESSATANVQLNKLVEDLELSRELIQSVLESQALRQFSSIQDEVVSSISRDVAAHLSHTMLQRLGNETVAMFGSEYVLLHNIEEFDFDVNLSAEFTDAETLRQAIYRALQYLPHKLPVPKNEKEQAEWFLKHSQNQREFALFLGKVGEDLFDLKWKGTVALKHVSREAQQLQIA